MHSEVSNNRPEAQTERTHICAPLRGSGNRVVYHAQTPLACEIHHVALWIAERIDAGMTAEDMIVVRNTLLSLASGVEELENNMCAAAQTGGAA